MKNDKVNMQKKRIATIIIVLWVTVCPHDSFASVFTELESPYPSMINRLDKLKQESQTCPIPPLPPEQMNFTSIYTDKRQGVSIVDSKAQALYQDQTDSLRQYENQIYKWIEEGFNHQNTSRTPISCAIDWLYHWAIRNAMLDIEISSQGEATRKWTLASLSSLYIQIRNTQWINNDKRNKIDTWLYNLADQVMADYQRDTHRTSRNNNHQYWAAWSVMITGVLLNEPKLYKWGIKNYKKAMEQIQEDGTLPLEVARERKAFHYHLFATTPLVMIAETAKKNGLNLYKYRQKALLKLINMNLEELESNQKYLTILTNKKQDLNGTITQRQLAWLIPYHQNYRDSRANKWIKELEPMIQRGIGGNLSRIYSAEK